MAGAMLLLGVVAQQATAQVTVNSIQVEGNRRVATETIQVFSGLQRGQVADTGDLNTAFQRLFDTGLFEEVSVTPASGGVLIRVVENPTINFINIEGNQRLDDEVIQEVIELRQRQPFSRAAAEADAQRIQELYAASGRINATVQPQIIRLEDNRVNLVYQISEAPVTEVQRISFTGNRVYSDRRLRRVIETGQAGLFSFFFRNDTYNQDRLELDKQQLREFYLNRGYIDFDIQAASAEFARERNAFFLNFRVFEGEQWSYGNMSVTTFARGLPAADFEALIDVRPGQVYSAKRIDRIIERMNFQAGQQGFAFVEIVPQVTRDVANRRVNINFELIEGPRVFIERIDIRGNVETVDRVIRREFRVVEGDAFNSRELQDAENRLLALGFFESVDVRVREGSSPGRAIITVDVVEQPTGSLTFGAAYGSSEGLTGTISLTERNFLGRGQTVAIDLAGGSETSVLSFSFTEPRIFDQDLSGGFSIYWREFDYDESSVNTRRAAFQPFLGFPLTDDSRLRLRARIGQDEIEIQDSNISPILEREAGDEFSTAIGATYTLDKRNSPVDPTAGFIFTLDQEFSLIGSGSRYSKTVATARTYTSLFDEEVILSAEVEGGALIAFNDETRFINRFNLGGDSFRGFERGGIGPRDICDNCGGPDGDEDVDDALGGNMFGVARLEATFPLGLPSDYGIYGGVFTDVGSVWSLYDTDGAMGEVDDGFKLRASAGVSLFWRTAIGPLRFNFATPYVKEEFDEPEYFRITIDTRF
ncbi:outer membrane protein assembly factor BamA [Halovulum sp. GXIMD14794]